MSIVRLLHIWCHIARARNLAKEVTKDQHIHVNFTKKIGSKEIDES